MKKNIVFMIVFFFVACSPSPRPLSPSPNVTIANTFDQTAPSNFKYNLKPNVLIDNFDPNSRYSDWVVENIPFWLQLDPSNGELSGITPSSGKFENIKVLYRKNEKQESTSIFSIQILSDPLFEQQWALLNTGQKTFSSGTGVLNEDIRVLSAYHSGFSGKNILIGVSDTAFEVEHEDLKENSDSLNHRDYINGILETGFKGTPVVSSDTHAYHGTGVAGIIAAVGWNNLGIRGVAPNAKIASMNFIESDQSLNKLIDQVIGRFDIINQSWGSSNIFPQLIEPEYLDALKTAVRNQRKGYGTIIVKAAGNGYNLCGSAALCSENANQDQYNNNPYTLVVGALAANGKKASYSAIGSSLWLSAPGGEFGSTSPAILTTDISGCSSGSSNSSASTNDFQKGILPQNSNCNYTSTYNGTSSAAPFVSGAIALILESNPFLSWRDVKYVLAKSARKVDPSSPPLIYNNQGEPIEFSLGWVTNAANFKFHNHYGFGAIDIENALILAKNHTPLPPANEFEMGSSTNISKAFGTSSVKVAEHKITVAINKIIETVEIETDITHSYFGDIAIEIISPSGTRSIVLTPFNTLEGSLNDQGQYVSTQGTFRLLSNAFYGENSQGEWTVRIKDQIPEDQGQLDRIKLVGFGHN